MELDYLPKVPAYQNMGNVFNISGQISLLGFDLDPAHPIWTTAGLCRQQERLKVPANFPPNYEYSVRLQIVRPCNKAQWDFLKPNFLKVENMLKRKYEKDGILYGQAPSVKLIFLEDWMGGPKPGIQKEDEDEQVYMNRRMEMIELLKSHEERGGLRFCLHDEFPGEWARDFVKREVTCKPK